MSTKLFLNGCNGRMGHVIRQLAADASDLEIVAGSDLTADPDAGFPIYEKASECAIDFDVIIDFSNPQSLPELYQLIRQSGKPAVICTTGLADADKQELAQCSLSQAIFISANMSLEIGRAHV